MKPLLTLYNPRYRESYIERIALHSGKAGDIIYTLPTIKALKINHLILCLYEGKEHLRRFPFSMAQQMAKLLIKQPFIQKVSIIKNKKDLSPHLAYIDFDRYREVARHRVAYIDTLFHPWVKKVSPYGKPIHLAHMFGAVAALSPSLTSPFLYTTPLKNKPIPILLSLTYRWRTYSDLYWKALLMGLPEIYFIGSQDEWEKASVSIPNLKFITTKDHWELAQTIRSCQLFLGTISLPYAIAEALKIKRGVEICAFNCNAFPLDPSGTILPPNIFQARRWLLNQIPPEWKKDYQKSEKHIKKLAITQSFKSYFSLQKGYLKQNFIPKTYTKIKYTFSIKTSSPSL